jgi:chloramphenicol-sensitive protein RarD
MGEGRKGVAAIVAAAVIWGLSGIYYKLLTPVPPLEVLSHRTLWSLAFFGVVLTAQRRGAEVAAAFARPRVLAALAISATMVAVNWLGFIWAVQTGRALEASLGYYIFPLFAVALGFLVRGERFTAAQTAAVGLAAAAVMVLTLGLGVAPWLALMLAASFGAYGLIKGLVPLGPGLSVFVETVILAPLALAWLWGVHGGHFIDIGGRSGAVFGRDLGMSAMLVFSGPLTATPLMLFAYAARRIAYGTLGLIQYLNPTLQFLVAVLLFGEPFTVWHAIAFPLIWGGLALYSWDGWRRPA